MIKIFLRDFSNLIKSDLSLYSLFYAEACNKLVGPISASLRARATQLRSKKCRSDGEPWATQWSIWSARNINLKPPVQETNVLSLDQFTN